MSRIAKKPLSLPKGVEFNIDGQAINIKGSKGTFDYQVHHSVMVEKDENDIKFRPLDTDDRSAWAMAGTMRALAANMVQGVSQGFEKKLQLVGVGYRAQAKGSQVNLSLGFSHPIEHKLPDGITAETPSQTEIIIRGVDKQKVGQVAADIRDYRPPEPYKGKGVKYADEHIIRKEAKKK
ncbi:MAG: 50S ribosomal protein L6 [bacterium]